VTYVTETRAALGAGGRTGARAGAVAAAAVTGALIGFGLRGGMMARPFNAIAALVLGDRARGVWGFDGAVSLAGGAVLLLCCVVAGAALGALVRTLGRQGRYRLAAFVAALATGALVVALVVARAPDLIGPSPVGALSLGQGVVLAVVAAVAFASGMGLAR
jgi:hypothetical protein